MYLALISAQTMIHDYTERFNLNTMISTNHAIFKNV